MKVSPVSFSANPNNVVNHNLSKKSEPINNLNDNKQDDKFNTKKCVCSVIALASLSGGLYVAGKRGYLGSTIKNKLTRGTDSSSHTASKPNANVMDSLSYEIKSPKISDIHLEKESWETDIQLGYRKIAQDIERDANTKKRFDEIQQQLREDQKSLENKLVEIKVMEPLPDNATMNPIYERSIYQKRYFSLPDVEKSPGHSCLDPLLYQKPREEIIDLGFGYNLLAPLRENSESKLLNDLLKKVKISQEDRNFVNECTEKMKPQGAANSGENSVIHASEHQRLGKIFREALGISVR